MFLGASDWELSENDCSVIASSLGSIILVERYTLLICFPSDLQKLELTSVWIHFMVLIALSIQRLLLALSWINKTASSFEFQLFIFSSEFLSGTVIKWSRSGTEIIFLGCSRSYGLTASAQYFAGFAKLHFESISVVIAVDVNTVEDCGFNTYRLRRYLNFALGEFATRRWFLTFVLRTIETLSFKQ